MEPVTLFQNWMKWKRMKDRGDYKNKIEKRKGEKETWIVQLDRGDWMM